jgi:CDP-4-dehydro-6-deoxyglucose reductase
MTANGPVGSAESAGAAVTVLPLEATVRLRPGETILTGLFRCGFSYRVGCRRGGCGICKVSLVTGAVAYPAAISPRVLTPEEHADGVCLSCRAVPTSHVVIRLHDGERLRRTFPLLWESGLLREPGGDPTTTTERADHHHRQARSRR